MSGVVGLHSSAAAPEHKNRHTSTGEDPFTSSDQIILGLLSLNTGINDINDNPLIRINPSSNPVNYLTISNADIGLSPSIVATGSDSNIDINITPKGDGSVSISSGVVSGGTKNSIIGGENNTITNGNRISVIGGYSNDNVGSGNNNSIIGGQDCGINSNNDNNTIIGSTNSTIILSGDNNTVIGSTNSNITSSGNNNMVIGASGSSISGSASGTTIIGGNLLSNQTDTLFVNTNEFEAHLGVNNPIQVLAGSGATSDYNSIMNAPRPGTTSGGATWFINGSTRVGEGDGSAMTIRNDDGKSIFGSTSQSTEIKCSGNMAIDINNAAAGSSITLTNTSATGDSGINFVTNSRQYQIFTDESTNWLVIGTAGVADYYLIDPTQISAVNDNARDLGSGIRRWRDIYGFDGIVTTSDERQKENITDLNIGIDFINKLRPKSFKWKDTQTTTTNSDGTETTINNTYTRKHAGLIAQQVEQTMNEMNIDNDDFAGLVITPEGDYGIRIGEFTPILIKGVQELSEKITSLQEQNKNYESVISSLLDRVSALENA